MASPVHWFNTFPGDYSVLHAKGSGIKATAKPGESPSSNNLATPGFNIFDWHIKYQNCQRFFLHHAQYLNEVQAVCALINIRLPFQCSTVYHLPLQHGSVASSQEGPASNNASLVPYIRRLVVTGMDRQAVMLGFFGEDWKDGIGHLHACERKNFLFTAKSSGWAATKAQYDMLPYETVPFIKSLQNSSLDEIEGAEKEWSSWLAMEDWMLGSRAPDGNL